ncbi:MAG: copper-binding protein [Quisquiliibacterium sp.]
MFRLTFFLLVSVLCLPVSSVSVQSHAHQPHAHGSAAASGQMAEAEVRKVDAASGRITLAHGEIRNLDMPPMTMTFRARDPAMLEGFKPGDKVRFAADQIDDKYVVTALEPAR